MGPPTQGTQGSQPPTSLAAHAEPSGVRMPTIREDVQQPEGSDSSDKTWEEDGGDDASV